MSEARTGEATSDAMITVDCRAMITATPAHCLTFLKLCLYHKRDNEYNQIGDEHEIEQIRDTPLLRPLSNFLEATSCVSQSE